MNNIIKWILRIVLNLLCLFVIFSNSLFIYLKSMGVLLLIASKTAEAGVQMSQFNISFFCINIILALFAMCIFNLWLSAKPIVKMVEIKPSNLAEEIHKTSTPTESKPQEVPHEEIIQTQ